MLRLLALLCAGMFVALLIGGEDRGQLRPGLVAAEQTVAPQTVAPTVKVSAAPVATPPAPVAHLPVVLPLIRPVAEVTAPSPSEPESEIRYVNARAVNVREGPSTEFPVVDRLTRGEAIRVMWVEENGWVRIAIEGDGVSGFVSGDLLTGHAP